MEKRVKTFVKLSLALLLSIPQSVMAQGDTLLVMFWNVENFFDWRDDGRGGSESEFSSGGQRHWTRRRFYAKCNSISKTVMMVADAYGRIPDAIGFAEVENAFVLRQLLGSSLLRKAGYEVIHFDSPDRRGIDCGLVYRKSVLDLVDHRACHIYDSLGAVLPTRDILLARFCCKGDSLAVLVNHHPSKLGGGAGDRRNLAMQRMWDVMDSLEHDGCRRILSMGDFNDTLWGEVDSGTIRFNGRWEKIDGGFHRGMDVDERVWNSRLLCTPDRRFGGMKPLRTYSGPRYLGGVSDHLPVVFQVRLQNNSSSD